MTHFYEESDIRPLARRVSSSVEYKNGFLMFGGFGINGNIEPNNVTNEIWMFDQEYGWSFIESAGPAVRYPSVVKLDNSVYIFGGCGVEKNSLNFSNDVYLYSNKGFIKLTRDNVKYSPDARYASAIAHTNKGFVIYGGCGYDNRKIYKYYSDLWVFDKYTSNWECINDGTEGPGKRYGFGWTSFRDKLYIFGGFDGCREHNDLWSLDLNVFEWTILNGGNILPDARYCPALGYVDNVLIMTGGRSKTNSKLNYHDTWVYNGIWHRLSTDNSPGYHAKSAYCSDGKKMWLFGGEGKHGHVSDLWKFSKGIWSCIQSPSNDDPLMW
ncbi:hypothetical protein HOL24_14950 [bacterium]|jgi:N-acetylneuraminic acid mutarotase|nr:hypothetical protein [bacterium]